MLQNTKLNKGFTLVELLIVIVVIAILAAISIVAYNGIQDRAKTTTGNELASQVAKKIGALNAVSGSYFSDPAAGITGSDINTLATAANADEAQIDDTASVAAATSATAGPSDTDNGEIVYVWGCADGAVVIFWDYTTGAVTTSPLVVGSGC